MVSYTRLFIDNIITCLICQPDWFSDISCFIFTIFFCGISGGGGLPLRGWMVF
jgi:hypothetical protein